MATKKTPYSDLLDVLRASEKSTGGEGLTIKEIAEATGRAEKWVRERMRDAKAKGSIVCVRKCVRSLSDQIVSIPAYKATK
jgi:hypothetical protein